jgi:hypothetical protein
VLADTDPISAGYVVERGCRYLDLSSDAKTAFIQGRCAGIVETPMALSTDACVPDKVTIGQAIRVIVKYVNDHPNNMHLDFKVLGEAALKQAWPCQK